MLASLPQVFLAVLLNIYWYKMFSTPGAVSSGTFGTDRHTRIDLATFFFINKILINELSEKALNKGSRDKLV